MTPIRYVDLLGGPRDSQIHAVAKGKIPASITVTHCPYVSCDDPNGHVYVLHAGHSPDGSKRAVYIYQGTVK